MKLSGVTILVVLLIVTVAWVGFGVYFNTTALDIDPNATSYMQYINPVFDKTSIEELRVRIEENLPISPSEFQSDTNLPSQED